jgi:uncharacterized protein YdbL (DUF1318 family)
MKKISVLTALSLTACVTINIYFPAAAAEKAADEIIKDIQDAVPGQNLPKPKPKAALDNWQLATLQAIDQAIAVLISSAEAAEADLSINSPEIRQLTASMEERFASLKGFYASGAIGIKSDGLLAVKDPASVALQDRNQVTKLVAAENKDRQALYQAIANANGHPEWAAQIKATFATRWASNAQAGWWYQSSGTWKQK